MSRSTRRQEDESYREWAGAYRPYDILREAAIALLVVLVLVVGLTILFSSPDDPASTIKSWSRGDPVDFVTTASTELDGTSGTGSYGPPYNHNSDGQHMAFIHLAKWFGVSHPINSAQDFVLAPLRSLTGQPALNRQSRPTRQRRQRLRAAGRPLTRPRSARHRSRPTARSRSSPAATGRCRP